MELQRRRRQWIFSKKGKFELLALAEIRLKGKKKVSWYGVNDIIAGAQEMERAGEGVAILLNDGGCIVQW